MSRVHVKNPMSVTIAKSRFNRALPLLNCRYHKVTRKRITTLTNCSYQIKRALDGRARGRTHTHTHKHTWCHKMHQSLMHPNPFRSKLDLSQLSKSTYIPEFVVCAVYKLSRTFSNGYFQWRNLSNLNKCFDVNVVLTPMYLHQMAGPWESYSSVTFLALLARRFGIFRP